MGEGNASFRTGAAPVGTTGAAPAGTGAGNGGVSPTKAKSVSDIMSLLDSPTKLSKEGEAYIETIASALTKAGREPKMVTINGANYEARVLQYNDYVAAFVFAETYVPGTPPLPPASVSEDLRYRLAGKGVDGIPALFYVITKEDYERVDRMAAFIVNAFKCHDTPVLKDLTVAMLSNGNYGLTDDMTVIRPFVEQHNPLATLPRMDLGIMLYESKPVENNFGFGQGRQEYQQMPILAVTGYVDFVYAENNNNGISSGEIKFVPFFVVTGIFSKIVDSTMSAIGLPLVAYLMVAKTMWTKQFSYFKKDKPDIGNLLRDKETGKPCAVKDISQRNAIINQFLTTPYPAVAVDLQLGGYMTPGLGKLIDAPNEFANMVDRFTGGEGARKFPKAYELIVHNFDGRIRMGKTGEYVDTRTIDFLSLTKNGYQQDEAARLLKAEKIPAARSQVIQQIYPEAEMLYVTYRTFLNPYFLMAVAEELNRTLKVHIDAVMDVGAYNIGALTSWQTAGINNMAGFAIGNSMGSFTAGWGWC